MQKINYQKILDETINNNLSHNLLPTLLLHSCCAPCSSYCLDYLSKYFKITVYYYNPNIYPPEEYSHRVSEQQRLICLLNDNISDDKFKIGFIEGPFERDVFYETVKGMENLPEGGERCFKCYELRMRHAAQTAKENHFDYFTTTLTLSPLKNSQKINEIGRKIADEYGVAYLFSDFKKNEGFKKSIELSHKFNLYRQNYCGCEYSIGLKD